MNNFFKFNSLKKRIVLYITIVMALCVVVSAFIVSIVVDYQMSRKYQVEKEAAIESLSYSLAPMLELYDYRQVEMTLKSSLVYENISYVAVYDLGGNLVRSVSEKDVSPAALDINRHDISLEGSRIGSFEIGFSSEYIDNQIRTTTLALMFGVAGFLIIAGLGFYFFLNRYVIAPIESFTSTVKKFSPENLSLRMEAKTDDEIGTLATSFNRMADDLEKSHGALVQARDELELRVEERTRGERRRSEQLRQINEVGRRISSILSLDELLPYVATSLQETFGFYNVNIFLAVPDSDDLLLRAGAGGYSRDVPADFKIQNGEGIIGWVAEHGKPLTAGDVSREPRYIAADVLPDTKSEMAVPIKAASEILGVLDVESVELGAFDEIDLFTAETLADQVAIAVENARLYRETREMAVLDERNRMAREIHDTLAQGFTGIVLQLEAAEQTIDRDKNAAMGHLDRARELARDSLNEARRSVWALRPQTLEKSTLVDTLRRQTEKFTRDTGIPAAFTADRRKYELPAEKENALVRICQEALANVQRHARANKVDVRLGLDDNRITLIVQDDGTGFDTATVKEGSFGIIGMRERVRLLGGTLEIDSAIEKGTRLEAGIPLTGGQP
jgi:signal transduction histidine kinase